MSSPSRARQVGHAGGRSRRSSPEDAVPKAGETGVGTGDLEVCVCKMGILDTEAETILSDLRPEQRRDLT